MLETLPEPNRSARYRPLAVFLHGALRNLAFVSYAMPDPDIDSKTDRVAMLQIFAAHRGGALAMPNNVAPVVLRLRSASLSMTGLVHVFLPARRQALRIA